MARYTGPKWRVSRALDYPIYAEEKYKNRPSKPGMHVKAFKGRSGGYTAYSRQFTAKQKIKKLFGMQEAQFKRFFVLAQKSQGNVANKLMETLEMRLDNVVYRLGLAMSRPQARQFVAHGHVKVNGKRLDIPSYLVQVGDEITVIDKVSDLDTFKLITESTKSRTLPGWLNSINNGGVVLGVPTADHFEKGLDSQAVVELYNR